MQSQAQHIELQLTEHQSQEPNFELLLNCQAKEMEAVVAQVLKAAKARLNLVQGETGTGKEVVARALYEKSRWGRGNFVVANCAAVPENLCESLFFGHEKGAFTGAHMLHKGVFERASGGCVFLDEIGELPLNLQPRFLRVLQDQTLTRVGGATEIKVDCKVIAATNRNLRQMVKEDKFREDLYYRLIVFPIYVPPLRKRMGDIMYLARHFTERVSSGQAELASECSNVLLSHDWRGNARELENAIERAFISLDEGETVIKPEHFSLEKEEKILVEEPNESTFEALAPKILELIEECGSVNRFKVRLIRHLHNELVVKGGATFVEFSRRLGLKRATLYRYIQSDFDMDQEDPPEPTVGI